MEEQAVGHPWELAVVDPREPGPVDPWEPGLECRAAQKHDPAARAVAVRRSVAWLGKETALGAA